MSKLTILLNQMDGVESIGLRQKILEAESNLELNVRIENIDYTRFFYAKLEEYLGYKLFGHNINPYSRVDGAIEYAKQQVNDKMLYDFIESDDK